MLTLNLIKAKPKLIYMTAVWLGDGLATNLSDSMLSETDLHISGSLTKKWMQP